MSPAAQSSYRPSSAASPQGESDGVYPTHHSCPSVVPPQVAPKASHSDPSGEATYRSSQAGMSPPAQVSHSASSSGSSPYEHAPPSMTSSTHHVPPGVLSPQVSPKASYSEPTGDSWYRASQVVMLPAAQSSHSPSRYGSSP